MDKIQKFGRNSRRFFKRIMNRETDKEDLNLNFTTHIYEEHKSITWNLENFNSCPLKFGEYLQTPTFVTGFSSYLKWNLRIYPKGKTGSGKVGLYLYKEESSNKVAAEFDIYIGGPGRVVENLVLSQKNRTRLNSDAGEYGSDIDARNTPLLHENSIKIICNLTVGYLDEADESRNCNAGSSTFCTLSSDLKELYSSGKFSDINFQVGKKQIPAHKTILAARSQYFAAMFGHPMEESHTNVVNVDDFEPSVFWDLLHYIYTGTVEDMNIDKSIALFPAADKYGLEELKKWCVKVILARMTAENACKVAVLADEHSEPKLKAAANYCIRKYKYEIFETKEWNTLICERQQLASEILSNVCSEFNHKFKTSSTNVS